MKRRWFFVWVLLFVSTASYANWFQDIINTINKQAGVTNNILNNELSLQNDMLTSQKDIQSLMAQVQGSVTGHSGMGGYRFHDYQTYGKGAYDWADVIRMAERGQGNGALGSTINRLAREFPLDQSAFNRAITDVRTQRYYAMKSETILATRAASQLDYNKIQDQIAYQQMLLGQIENTENLKAAIDLSNRIQVEGNLIALEVLRQAALANQQQAVTEQATVMSALVNAKFLTK